MDVSVVFEAPGHFHVLGLGPPGLDASHVPSRLVVGLQHPGLHVGQGLGVQHVQAPLTGAQKLVNLWVP